MNWRLLTWNVFHVILICEWGEAMPTLKELRTNAKLTQKQLALLVGVSERTVIFWEMGSVLPSFESLQKLNEVLGPKVLSAFQVNLARKRRGRKPKGGQEI
jgi:DNA-binding XRE family transcriptional regulator